MAFDDRGYGSSSPHGRFGAMPHWVTRVLHFLNLTFPIGTYFNVAVRIHILYAFLVLYLLLELGDLFVTLRIGGLMFLCVLLHEFGHVFGCRSVGGSADRILMWPLGGLAFCDAPRRPWPEFVTVACGPLVNLVLAIVCYIALLPMLDSAMLPSFHPLRLWHGGAYEGLAGLVTDAFYVNYMLLLFNLAMMFYPFDGGRLVQVALWSRVGYQRSMRIATVVGMVGAVGVAFYGIVGREMLLVFIAVFGFVTCYQQRRALSMGADIVDPYGNRLAEGDSWKVDAYDEPAPGPLARWVEARAERKAEQQQQREQATQREIDRILAKVHDEGIAALTEKEKRTLADATERQRKR